MNYWSSTKAPLHALQPRSYHTPERDKLLRETAGVDPAMLVTETGLSEAVIRAYQRRLGVRALTGNKPRAK